MAFYLKTSVWQHKRICPVKPKNETDVDNYINNGMTIISAFVPALPEEEIELEKLFLGMKETVANSGIPKICQSDLLIRVWKVDARKTGRGKRTKTKGY